MLVPLGGGHHLALDADARDRRVAALLRALVLRLVATAPPGQVRVAGIDTAALGATFGPLRPLLDAGVLDQPATGEAEVAALLDAAERHARAAQHAEPHTRQLLLVVATAAPPPRELARLAALTHAGPAAAVCVLLAGHPSRLPGDTPPPLGGTTAIRLFEEYAQVGDPPGAPFSADGSGLAAPVLLDGDPPPASVRALAEHLGAAARRTDALPFAALLPERRWAESAANGLRTVIGRAGPAPLTVAFELWRFDDATPHWLVGGRTGAGKTVFLLDVLYGLAARYSPAELQLYLLDFKEGVSFTEFVPTGRDPSWLPHARAVGIESDREYGLAVLRELRREAQRRASALKRHGVTKLADLPRAEPLPRIVAVIDEFHVLLAGNDALAREAVDLLEELARKGRSYGVHLVLASQSMTGIEALYGRAEAIFGQFALRVALPGGGGVLDQLNDSAAAAADRLGRGQHRGRRGRRRHRAALPRRARRGRRPRRAAPRAVAGPPAGLAGPGGLPGVRGGARSRTIPPSPGCAPAAGARWPWSAGPSTCTAPPRCSSWTPPPAGTSPSSAPHATGADVLRAATLSLARQHRPGDARFLLAPLVGTADPVADDTATALRAAGHPVHQPRRGRAARPDRRAGRRARRPGDTWWCSGWTPPRRSSRRPTR